MAANIDINRDQGSTSTMTFTIVDEGGNAVDITNWTEFELVPFVSPAKEYTRYATFSDTGGGTFAETVRVIVGDTSLPDAKGITVTTPSKRTVYANSTVAGVPVFVKDTSDILDFMFDFSPLLQTDVISSFTVTSKNVNIHANYFDDSRVQIWLKDGIQVAEVTVRIKSNLGRTIERSLKVKIGEY